MSPGPDQDTGGAVCPGRRSGGAIGAPPGQSGGVLLAEGAWWRPAGGGGFPNASRPGDPGQHGGTGGFGGQPGPAGGGTIIEIYRGEDCIQTYTCKLYGDVNGDGKISAMDYMLIKNKIMEVKDITGTIQKDVADVNSDGKVSALDYMLIKNDILDVKKIDIK